MMLQKKHLLKMRRELAKVAAIATLFNATLLGNFISAPTAQASELVGADTILLSEIVTQGDKVELYSPDLANESMPTGWKLRNLNNGNITPDLTEITDSDFNSAGFLVLNLLDEVGNFFADAHGNLKLEHEGIVKDGISWGNNTSAFLPAPSSNTNSMSRHSEFGWFSNTSATLGALNEFPENLPTAPNAPQVAVGEVNSEGYINSESQYEVSAFADIEGLAPHSATIRFYKSDALSGSVVHNTGFKAVVSGQISVSELDLSDDLEEGVVYLRSFSRHAATGPVYSPWSQVGLATKDTTAPSPATFGDDEEVYVNGDVVKLVGSSEEGSVVRFYILEDEELGEQIAIIDGGNEFEVSLPLYNLNGVNNFVAIVEDLAGNTSDFGFLPVIIHDNIAPVVPSDLAVQYEKGDTALTLSWDFANEECEEDCGSAIVGFQVFGSLVDSFEEDGVLLGEVDAETSAFILSAFGIGERHFAVRSIDMAGNVSDFSESASVFVTSPKAEQLVEAGEEANFESHGLSLTPSGDTTVTVIGYDQYLPAGEVPNGIAFVGKYFDVEVDNNEAFPVLIKFYYNDEMLNVAGLSESQLQGIYFYDEATDSWMLYGDTGVNTAEGYVWANADHFTPIAIGGDNVAPASVKGLHAVSGDRIVGLTWDKNDDDAIGYIVRHRVATNKDANSPYTETYVDGVGNNSITIKGLENGVLYEFNIWAKDSVGNLSAKPAIVVQTPGTIPSKDLVLPGKDPKDGMGGDKPKAEEGICCIGGEVNPEIFDDEFVRISAPDSSDDKKEDDKSSSDQIKGDRDEQDENDETASASSSRALVTFLIIMAAGAAGFGGYYAYQWWVDRPTEKPVVKVKEKVSKKKKHQRNRRW